MNTRDRLADERRAFEDQRDEQRRELLRVLQVRWPCWWLMWGRYTRMCWAFPVFGTRSVHPMVVCAPDPDGLADMMGQVEAAAMARGIS